MASSRKLMLVCLVLCSLHAAAAFAPHTPAVFGVKRSRTAPVHAHFTSFGEKPRGTGAPVLTRPYACAVSMAAKAHRALEQTLQPATGVGLLTTQAALLLFKNAQGALGVAVDFADLFLSQKLLLRLVVGLCSVFSNKLLHAGKVHAFLVAQVVLAAFAACAGSELTALFTLYGVSERLSVYTLALHMPTLLRQVKKLARRGGLYMRSLRMQVSASRAFA